MPPSSHDARPTTPAIVLALALLGAMTAGGWRLEKWAQDAPGTILPVQAMDAKPSASTSHPPEHQPAEAPAGPGWETLTTDQKLALYPLAERWAVLSEAQKRRWLALAQTFSTLPQEEQEKLHSRMTEWANLSVQQRNQARINYANTQQLAPNDKLAQWEAYQALSDEQKRHLAAGAVKLPTGAALAIKPVPPQKLAQVPAATHADPHRANQPKIPPVADPTHRIATPVNPPASAVTPSSALPAPEAQTPSPVPVVETAPVVIPQATPSALPPMAAPEASTTTNPPMVTPDNSGLYPN